MSLNIKNEKTHRQAKELARLAGETMTEAVDRAVTEAEAVMNGRGEVEIGSALDKIIKAI